ncbi:hypothetical protein [Phytoactinopolyspora endophytica]|uniref:hypothetical protein n=1 Tax=Phytoactinopolyspora endophytica TaxID=1642495 RepID=UPI00101D2B8F|nr:hypothetical protein [Phytoactinopolyspora endophytica]
MDSSMKRRSFLGLGVLVAGSSILLDSTTAAAETAAGVPEIKNVFVETAVRDKELRVHVTYLPNEVTEGHELALRVSELNGETDHLPSMSVPLSTTGSGGLVLQTVTVPWADPRLWNVGDPYLYQLHVEITDGNGGSVENYSPVRFGFREVWTEGRDIIVNGEPIKLRMAPFIGGPEGMGPEWSTGMPQMLFYSGMGMNAMEFQPHRGPGDWTWANGCAPGVMQGGSEEVLDLADEQGFAVLMPTPSVQHIRDDLEAGEDEVIEEFTESFWHCGAELDRQNRPSIIGWIPTMNTGVDYDPENIGRTLPPEQEPAWAQVTEEIIKTEDPTRMVIHHNGSPGTDLQLYNFYLNLIPLQEREEWFSSWSEDGDRPWGSCEFGPPMSGNFFRGRLGDHKDGIPYYTEYFAAYLGDKAYAQEGDAYVEAVETLDRDEAHVGSPNGSRFQQLGFQEQIGEFTAYYDYMDLFIRNTNKSYRGWGVNGGLFPWIQDVAFGKAPGHEHGTHRWLDFHYRELAEIDGDLTRPPEWANRIYHSYRDTLQPLLVFVGGPAERFTAKDHTYHADEQVEKTIVAVWDGPGSKQVGVEWQLVSGEEVLASGEEAFDLAPGTVERRPIQFTLPAVNARTQASLQVSVQD